MARSYRDSLTVVEPGVVDQAALCFGSGRVAYAKVVHGEETLEVRSPSGRIELTVRLLDTGPVLSFESAAVEIKTPSSFAIDCDTFDVRARSGIHVETDGDSSTRIGGRETVYVEGPSARCAAEVDLVACEGEVRVQSASDTWINASMVLLNCDREQEMAKRAQKGAEEHEAERIRALDKAELSEGSGCSCCGGATEP